jgi:hypothetical protein
MRRNVALLAVTVLLGGGTLFAVGEEVTYKGEVIEVSCYSKLGVAKGTGAAHVACALDCAKQGKPLGLLTDGDGLFKFMGDYTANNNAKLLPFVGKQVEVKGTRDVYTDYTYAIRATKITVSK